MTAEKKKGEDFLENGASAAAAVDNQRDQRGHAGSNLNLGRKLKVSDSPAPLFLLLITA